MKKIKFYILKKDEINVLKIWNENKNSLIFYENENFYFKSHYKLEKEKISLKYEILDINKQLIELIEDKLLYQSYIEASSISNEPIFKEKIKGSIIGTIKNILNRFSYDDGDLSIFDLFTDIFIKLLMNHHLFNGNKRFALSFLRIFLWEMGYYLYFTKGEWKKYEKHKTKIEDFVIKLENKNNIKSNVKEIKKWIQQNIVIALHWR